MTTLTFTRSLFVSFTFSILAAACAIEGGTPDTSEKVDENEEETSEDIPAVASNATYACHVNSPQMQADFAYITYQGTYYPSYVDQVTFARIDLRETGRSMEDLCDWLTKRSTQNNLWDIFKTPMDNKSQMKRVSYIYTNEVQRNPNAVTINPLNGGDGLFMQFNSDSGKRASSLGRYYEGVLCCEGWGYHPGFHVEDELDREVSYLRRLPDNSCGDPWISGPEDFATAVEKECTGELPYLSIVNGTGEEEQ